MVELIVVMVMTLIFTGIISNFMIGYWRYSALLEADLTTLSTRLNAGDFIRENIATSTGLVSQNSIPDNNPGLADSTISSGLFWQPIHAIPGNKPIGGNGVKTPLVYYRRPSLDASKAFIMNGTQPYEDEFIYYLDGSTKSLMQRTLANPNAVGNRVKTSCPPSSATASCPADKTIATDLASIDMRYFSRAGNLINYTSIVDSTTGNYIGPDFTAVEVVEFNINLTKKPFLQQTNATQNSTIIRVALRNA
ncbi:MAG TPA: hypothetical protein VF575_04180 [Candidatus Saccharimonadales bacterium]|jgi:hypothetical protein